MNIYELNETMVDSKTFSVAVWLFIANQNTKFRQLIMTTSNSNQIESSKDIWNG